MKTQTSQRRGAAGALAALALLAAACGGGDDTKTVTAADYAFQNLPRTVDAGTEFTLKNDSAKEVHEMVFIRIPDAESRPVSELARLPESELGRIFAGDPAMVLIRPPGDNTQVIKAVGDGKLTEKGRYAVICAIPTGADPQAYLTAAQASQGGPPDVPGGPPHFVQGMYGEVTVK